MTFYPAINGRATQQLTTSRLLFQIHADQSSIQDLQEQLSTGRRISRPSQDPSSAIRALSARRQIEFKEQTDRNLGSADTILSASESTLAQVQNLTNEMRGLAVQAVGVTLSPDESDALISQVQAAVKKLAEIGNSKIRDQFLFGGSNVLNSPFSFEGDSVRFSGNAEQLNTLGDFSATVTANVTADESFGVKSTSILGRVDLDPSLSLDTRLADLNRGEGINRGAISIGDGVERIELDLADAHDIRDIAEAIGGQSLSGRQLSVSLSPNGLNISYADGFSGLLKIGDIGSGTMASELGIDNTETAGLSPITGSDLNPILKLTTPVSDLLAGTGLTLGQSFRIDQGDRSFVISTTGIETVEDLTNRIHRSGAQVKASIDPTGRFLAIQSIESGTTLSIGENGSDLASTLGIRTFDNDTAISELNFGQGIETSESGKDDIILTRSDGTEMPIDLAGVQTVEDVINRINNNVDNFVPGLRIFARFADVGNGLVLEADAGAQPISIRNAGGSSAAYGLGLIPLNDVSQDSVDAGASTLLQGSDVSGVEVEGVFTSLIRMRQAIESGRTEDLTRIADALDQDVKRVALARGFVGIRQQNIQSMSDLSAEQQIQLKEIESNELDADLATTISDLTAKQAALQASLTLMGQATRLTLFDYI